MSTTLALPPRLEAVDSTQAEHAERLRNVVVAPGPADAGANPDGSIDPLRAAALQKPIDPAHLIRGDPHEHLRRVILGRTITLGVRG